MRRQFQVLIKESYSEVGYMKTGVPQGKLIGPVLFVIHTSSLHCLLESLNVSFLFYTINTQGYMIVDNSPYSQEKPTHLYEAVR